MCEKLKVSASSIKTYTQCPKKYYFNYIEKAKRKEWDHFDLGNLCHKALEIFHKEYMEYGLSRKKTFESLMKHSFSLARKEYNINKVLLLEAKTMLNDYLVKIKSTKMPMVKSVEESFEFGITDDIIIRGFIDRVDIMDDGKFHIVDYKTTKKEKYLDKFQLLLYGLWLKQKYPNINSFKGSYVLLRHKSKYKSYNFNAKDLSSVEKEIIKYASSITKDDEWKSAPSMLCNWCDFYSICPEQESW